MPTERKHRTLGAMELFPPLPLDAWQDTKATVHRFCQIVGKIRLASSPQRNHWWNIAYHLTGRGLTTRPMGGVDGNPLFTIDFDFVEHQLRVSTLAGRETGIPLYDQSVATFYHGLLEALAALGVTVHIEQPYPYDLPDAHRAFGDDTEHDVYSPGWVLRYWQVLSQVAEILEEFAAGYSGKVSAVHHFWHTFDLAHTRFSDRRVDHSRNVSRVVREAYSREVISFGFWFGDESLPEPAFYAYAAPEPAGLPDQPLLPAAASWVPQDGHHLAVLRYSDARDSDDPRATVLAFYDSAYQSAAELAQWDVGGYASPHGVTDPVRERERIGVEVNQR